jgi:PAS domain S-box-containing protein
MRHIVFKENDKEALKKAIKEAKKKKYKSKLIQLFSSITDKVELKKLLSFLSKKFPDTIIIGATTAGEIAHAKMYENSSIISLSLFQKTNLKAQYIKKITTKSGIQLSSKICNKNTKASIILSEGLNGEDYEGFIKGFKKENPNIIISGGLAGDNFNLVKTSVFLNGTVYNKGSVAISFSGKSLFADNKYNLNWIPIGKEFTITSSNGNVVHQIDNQSAVSLFKKYLGEDIFLNDAQALPDFQLLYKEGSTTVSRTPLTTDGDSLVFAAPLKEGQKVKFGFSNAASVISGSSSITSELKNSPAQAIYIFSCIARKTLLGNSLENEFKNFESIAPTAGFFTYGEYYSTRINTALLNCTTTLLILSESKQKIKNINKETKKSFSSLDDMTFNALTHFIEQTSNELNSNVKLLNQYKSVVDESSLVSKTDKYGIITYVNDNFCKISKYKREELIGQNHNIVRDKAVSPFIFKKMWDVIKKGKLWKGSFSNNAKDGSIYYVYATIMPIFNSENKIEEYIAIRQDITKQIQSKKRIKEKEKLIKAVFDNQDSIVIYASKTQGMLSVNKTLFKYLEYKSFEDFKEKNKCICDLFLEEEGYIYTSKHPNWLDDIAMDEDNDYKVKILIKNNTVSTFNVKIKRIDDEYIINLSDITNLEQALLKAYSSEQAKSIFLANMSHEIRTPLNGILGFTDVLTKRNLDKDSRKYIDIIHKSGQSLLNVVNDILDFSKLESGELTINPTESNLFLEMEAAVSTFASISKNKHIDYYTYIDTSIPKILKCDTQRIKQIVNNLISNAIKFTPENGKVSVSISLKELVKQTATIDFSIKDTGIGIPENKIASIFKAFSQADESISRKFGGTGLGLSISSQYTQMMGSELKVKSKKDKGSEFYFELTLPVLNSSKNFDESYGIGNIDINILQPETTIECGINEIVESYLKTWKCNYKVISSLEDIDTQTDVLIVCAKNFDYENCKKALDNFEKLQLIYIEGGDDKVLECTHPKYHLLSQPMTGSALFDKIVTFAHGYENNEPSDIPLNQTQHKIFHGNILVAEDNETNQMLISIMLESRKLNYKIVSNGKEVVDEALRNDYNIIFMDINMPIMDGVTATKLLREKNYKKTIISLSANVIESDIQTFKEAGIDASLNKPIVPEELDNILKHYLNTQSQDIKYDIVDIGKLSDALSLPNKDIIMKLLISFSTSVNEIIKTLKEKKIDKDIIHSIKGLSGNLRFNEIYKLSIDFEKEIDDWSEDIKKQKQNLMLKHLSEVVKNIELLND